LYNPRSKAVEAGKVDFSFFLPGMWLIYQTVIVANEQIDIYATIQNPLAFELEIADFSLM
jgi:hypothetical protein